MRIQLETNMFIKKKRVFNPLKILLGFFSFDNPIALQLMTALQKERDWWVCLVYCDLKMEKSYRTRSGRWERSFMEIAGVGFWRLGLKKEETRDATFPRKHGTYWSKRIAL